MKSPFRGKMRLHASRDILRGNVDDERFLRISANFARLIRTSVQLCDPDFPEDEVNYIEELLGLSFVLLQAKIRRVGEAAAKASLLARFANFDKTQLPSVDQAKAKAKQTQRGQQPEIKIRCAWQLTKTGEQFAQAIEDRGLILVYVSREEAAKPINRQNRALKEGFAVVDRRGNVYQVDQGTTGDASNARALGGPYKDTGKSLAELIWAVGNYYKHCDEWDREVWEDKKAGEQESKALRQSRHTRRIIEKVRIKRCTHVAARAMRTAYDFFEIDWASNCAPLANKVQKWAMQFTRKCANP